MGRMTQLLFDFAFGERKAPRDSRASVTDANEPADDSFADDASVSAETVPSMGGAGNDEVLTALARNWSRELGLRKLPGAVAVRWNRRLKTTAGTAHPGTFRIDLNPQLQEFDRKVTIRVLKHELAHLVAHCRARGRRIASHGPEWKLACAQLGIPNEKSCHTLPFKTRRQRRKHAYQCPSCQSVVLRVKPFTRYSACWNCCKQMNKGRYSKKFQFEKISLEQGMQIYAEQNPGSDLIL